ncbi:MAG: isocitrate/isopropylmalate family dehydrogenase [Leifsonia sp.]
MLEHLGHNGAAAAIVAAIEATLASGVMTSDIGGTATTEQATNAIIESLVSVD